MMIDPPSATPADEQRAGQDEGNLHQLFSLYQAVEAA
jgi:hypothetical protein